jgi:hypothetical protein
MKALQAAPLLNFIIPEARVGRSCELNLYVNNITDIARRLPLLFALRLFGRGLPGRGRGPTANAILERYYARFLYGGRCLYELAERPRLHILATNVTCAGGTNRKRHRSAGGQPSFASV